MNPYMLALTIYAVVMTFSWFIAKADARKQEHDMLLEAERFRDREKKDPEKEVMKNLIDDLRGKNEELANQIAVIGNAVDTIVEEFAMMKFKENPELIYGAIQELQGVTDNLLDVAEKIEDYGAIASFTQQINAVKKKMNLYISTWEKSMKGVS